MSELVGELMGEIEILKQRLQEDNIIIEDLKEEIRDSLTQLQEANEDAERLAKLLLNAKSFIVGQYRNRRIWNAIQQHQERIK